MCATQTTSRCSAPQNHKIPLNAHAAPRSVNCYRCPLAGSRLSVCHAPLRREVCKMKPIPIFFTLAFTNVQLYIVLLICSPRMLSPELTSLRRNHTGKRFRRCDARLRTPGCSCADSFVTQADTFRWLSVPPAKCECMFSKACRITSAKMVSVHAQSNAEHSSQIWDVIRVGAATVALHKAQIASRLISTGQSSLTEADRQGGQ